MLTDATGDQIGNGDTDIRSVSIAENSSTTRNLVFTLKIGASQGAMTPNGRWIVTFKANATDYFVAMTTSPDANGGAPTFHYGTGTSGFGGSDDLGRGLAGSGYDASSGTVRIVAPNADFKINPGDSLSAIAAAVRLSGGACGVACLNGASADTAAASTTPYMVGAACGTLQTVAGGLNDSLPGPIYGGLDISRPADARYQVFEPPAGIGADGSAGEYSIGYNPKTKRAMVNSLGFSKGPSSNPFGDIELFSAKVFRITAPELRTPELAASCDAQWEDKSNIYNNMPMVVSDPILWTDQDTGRTFSADLTTGPNPSSQYAYTDDDGENWIPAGLGIAGADHQTITSGFYPANSPFEAVARTAGFGKKDASGKVVKGKAVYFCSQDLLPGTCTRSDDGGTTWSPPQVAYTGLDNCSNLHGHLKVAPDGTAYLPVKGCGSKQGGSYTTDAGLNWKEFAVPGTRPQTDGSDPSIAIDDAGTLYYCYVNGDGRIRAVVGEKLSDGSLSWGTDTDLGSAHGLNNATFPEAIAGDAGRAACGFVATKAAGTNYQSKDFTGVWYLYIATTTDGGASWTTVNATPNDPVQGVGGIWQQGGSGDSNNNRNLLDFNEVTMDEQGRVLFGYNDGCVGACNTDPVGAVTYVASMRVVRQTGGKTLRAAYDNVLGKASAPGAACLSGADASGAVQLSWKRPDNGGGELAYDIERVFNDGSAIKVGQTDSTSYAVPSSTLATSAYRVSAVNSTGATPSAVLGTPGAPPVVNRAPTSTLSVTPSTPFVEGDEVTFLVGLADSDGDALQYTLDFGDDTEPATGTGNATVKHTYALPGDQSYTATLTVVETATSPALAAGVKTVTVTQLHQNTAPTSSLTVTPLSMVEGDEVKFVIDMADADGDALRYHLDFGDGSLPLATGTAGETIFHTYAKTGNQTYNAVLTVKEIATSTPLSATDKTITVTQAAKPAGGGGGSPAITIDSFTASPSTGDVTDGALRVTFTARATDSDMQRGKVSYTFYYGNGEHSGRLDSGTVSYDYHYAGTYHPYVIVADDHANSATAETTVTTTTKVMVMPGPVTARLSVSFDGNSSQVPATVTLDGSGSTSYDGAIYDFDFGDGTAHQVGTSRIARHVYTTAGSFAAKLTVSDRDEPETNHSTAEASVNITAVNQTVAQLSISPSRVKVGETVYFDASASLAASGHIGSYTFDFGDGTTLGPQPSPKAEHAYSQVGSFVPSVTVSDSQAQTSVAKGAVRVDGPSQTTPAPTPTPTPTQTPVSVQSGSRGGALPLWTLLPLMVLGIGRRKKSR